jgi:ppGpp synthetase/RelA/SpoT-type nucleotidyltranferase
VINSNRLNTNHEQWLDDHLPLHERLSTTAASILSNLLQEQQIEHLAITSRTKTKQSALEKIKRKGYSDLSKQFTDLSGVRVIVFFESDVKRVSQLVEKTFLVDKSNSLDKDTLLLTNQLGYRSVHYVCDLGTKRSNVDEYHSIAALKFEVQLRTALQHAWAEIAHDRNYKFAGKLPKELERKLFLYAGLLELADRGFDETAQAIDIYSAKLLDETAHGNFDLELTSLSLAAYVEHWAKNNGLHIIDLGSPTDIGELIQELNSFGIFRINELNAIVRPEYAEIAKRTGETLTIFGTVRDWMLLKDWRRFIRDVKFGWTLDEAATLAALMSDEEYRAMYGAFRNLEAEAQYDDGYI